MLQDSEVEGILKADQIQALIDGDHSKFASKAMALHAAALEALEAIDAKDHNKLSDVGGAIDEACEQCHTTYWYPDERNQPRRRRQDAIARRAARPLGMVVTSRPGTGPPAGYEVLTMAQENLRELLAQLHTRLGHAKSLDPESRKLLTTLLPGHRAGARPRQRGHGAGPQQSRRRGGEAGTGASGARDRGPADHRRTRQSRDLNLARRAARSSCTGAETLITIVTTKVSPGAASGAARGSFTGRVDPSAWFAGGVAPGPGRDPVFDAQCGRRSGDRRTGLRQPAKPGFDVRVLSPGDTAADGSRTSRAAPSTPISSRSSCGTPASRGAPFWLRLQAKDGFTAPAEAGTALIVRKGTRCS